MVADRGELSSLPTGGDHKSTRYLQGRALQPAFSPDGRWMAYAADESGSWEVFVQSVPAGRGKWKISNHGGAQPVWRRDGKELFYIGGAQIFGEKIFAVRVNTGASFEVGVPKELFDVQTSGFYYFRRHYSVTPDGQRFLVNEGVDDHPSTILLQNWLSPAR